MANNRYIAEFNMSDGFTPHQVAKLNQNFRELKSLTSGGAQAAAIQGAIGSVTYPAGFSSIGIGQTAVNADSSDDSVTFIVGDHVIISGDDEMNSVSFSVDELTSAQTAALLT